MTEHTAYPEILTLPHEHLRSKAHEISDNWDDALIFAQRMVLTMNAAQGIGLAANQVRDERRIIVVEATGGEQPPMLLANPEIVFRSLATNTHEEGCLSIPGFTAPVVRPADVTVKAIDLAEGSMFVLEATGLLATCLQHEIDHLDGVLFIDHLSRLRRKRVLAQYLKTKEQADGN